MVPYGIPEDSVPSCWPETGQTFIPFTAHHCARATSCREGSRVRPGNSGREQEGFVRKGGGCISMNLFSSRNVGVPNFGIRDADVMYLYIDMGIWAPANFTPKPVLFNLWTTPCS